MAHVTGPAREAILNEVAGRLVALPRKRVARVAIDGIDGAGKTTFADELAQRIDGRPVIRATVDGFHRPREARYRRGPHSPEGFYRDSYDYDALREELLDPLSPGGSRLYRRAVFDVDADEPVDAPQERAPRNAILIFDGIFAHRPELRGYWDFSVLLRVAWARSHHIPNFPANWPTDPADPKNRRYAEGQELYFWECRPWELATVVINNEDLAAPFFE